MHRLILQSIILLMIGSFNVFADSNLDTIKISPYLHPEIVMDSFSQISFDDPQLTLPNPGNSSIKLGMVFTSEDLMAASGHVLRVNSLDDQINVDENSEKIIGVYLRSFF